MTSEEQHRCIKAACDAQDEIRNAPPGKAVKALPELVAALEALAKHETQPVALLKCLEEAAEIQGRALQAGIDHGRLKPLRRAIHRVHQAVCRLVNEAEGVD